MTMNAKKNPTPLLNAMRTEVQAVIHKSPEGRNQNGKRGSPSEDDVAQRAKKRMREQHLSTHGDQPAILNPAQGNSLAEGTVAQKTFKRPWRGDMKIPKDQEMLLESDDALDPPKPGNLMPTCRLPNVLWTQFHAVMERRNYSGSKSLSEDVMEQDEEQGSGSEADSESSDSDSNGAAVNTNAPKFTQTGPEFKKFLSERKQTTKSVDDLDSESEASVTISWDISPSQHLRKPEMPPDSSVEQPSPSQSNNRCHPSPARCAQIQRKAVSPKQIDPVISTQQSIVINLESEDSDIELAVPQALNRLTQTIQVESVIDPPSRVVKNASVILSRSPLGGAQEPWLANGVYKHESSSNSHSRQISVSSLDTHDLVDHAIRAESSSLDETSDTHDGTDAEAGDTPTNHGDTADLYPPASPTLEMLGHEGDKVFDDSRVLRRKPSSALSIVTQSEDEDQDMHMDIDEESSEEEAVVPPRPLRRKLSASLSIVTQDSEYNDRKMRDQINETLNKATREQHDYASDGDKDYPEYDDVESEHGSSKRGRNDDELEYRDNVSKHHESVVDIDDDSRSTGTSETRSEELRDAVPRGRDPIPPDSGSEVDINEYDAKEASTYGREDQPLSDEVEEMVHQQLQSDIDAYSQLPITSPARAAASNAVGSSAQSKNISEVQVPASSPVPAPSSPHNVSVHSKGKRKSNKVSEEEDVDSTLAKRRKNDGDDPGLLDRQNNLSSLSFDQAGRPQRREFMNRQHATRQSPASRTGSEFRRPATPQSDSRHDDSASAMDHHQPNLGNLDMLAETAMNNMWRPPEAQPQSFLDIIHRRFTDAYYDDYDAEQKHLLGACKLIQKLDGSGKHAPHQSMWDDFIIRNRVEYRQYLSDCSDAVEFPIPYEIFYYEEIKEPLYTKRIITPKVLADLLSIEEVSSFSSTPRSSRTHSRQRPSLLQQYSSTTRRSSLANVISDKKGISKPKSRRPSGDTSVNYPSPLVRHLDLMTKVPKGSRAETNNANEGARDDPINQDMGRSPNSNPSNKIRRTGPLARSSSEVLADQAISQIAKGATTNDMNKLASNHTPRPALEVPDQTSAVDEWLQKSQPTPPSVQRSSSKTTAPSAIPARQGSISPPLRRISSTRRSLPWKISQKEQTPSSTQTFTQPPKPLSAKAPSAPVPSTTSNMSTKCKRTTESEVTTLTKEPKHKSPKPSSAENKSEKKEESPWYAHPNTKYNEFNRSYMNLKSEKQRPQPTLLEVMTARSKQKREGRLVTGGIDILSWMK
jgi:hypothetical protein